MNEADDLTETSAEPIAKLPVLASLIALVGLADSVYLTVKHFTDEPVPCSLIEGCEKVLTSTYAAFAGIPIAAIGAAAYFAAFSLAVLAAFGNRMAWNAFGLQSVLMSAVTLWLLYLQGFVIGAFCQFCLVSAASTLGLLTVFITSRVVSR